MSCVILLGAGASKGTLGKKIPVSVDFGEYLNENKSHWNQEYPHLAAVIRFLEQRVMCTSEEAWALDKVWSAIDNRVKLRYIWGLNLPNAPFPPPNKKKIYKRNMDPWGLAGFELRCALASVYGVDLDTQIQKAAESRGTLKTKLEKLESRDCIISFNYDLLAEKILEKLNKKVVIANPWLNSLNFNDAILLCKPHGSLNWKQWVPENGKAVQILDNPMKKDEIDFYPEQNATIQPGVAAPVPFKSEIIFPELQLKDVSSFFFLLVAQWRCAIQCLSEADKLVVLGYGFPPEDLHAHYLFAEAIAKRKKNKKLEIEIYEICEQRFMEVKDSISKLLKPASCKYHCEYKGPVINE